MEIVHQHQQTFTQPEAIDKWKTGSIDIYNNSKTPEKYIDSLKKLTTNN